jgi:hypothetical protein
MAAHLTRCECEGFKKCCISSAVDGTDDGMLWNDSENGDVRRERERDFVCVCVCLCACVCACACVGGWAHERERERETVEMETVTLIGKGR